MAIIVGEEEGHIGAHDYVDGVNIGTQVFSLAYVVSSLGLLACCGGLNLKVAIAVDFDSIEFESRIVSSSIFSAMIYVQSWQLGYGFIR